MTDNQLLEAWTARGSDPAFAEMVRRYVDLVYSAALRQVGDPPLTEDVVQAVFLVLARKAASLRHMATLAGWLYRTTRFTASRAIRAEARRRRHEQEAASMNPTAHVSDSEDPTWAQVAPLLDEAMAALAEADRNAVLLGFFQAKPMGVVGEHLGVTEDAAKKRVSRAVDKLRGFLVRRGVTLSVAALAGALTHRAVQAAPAGLAVTVTAAAGKRTTVGASITTLVNGTMKIYDHD
jgi:RNA polymerase sigma factor (sigma-70 family)